MKSNSKIDDARTTCDGLNRLVRQLNGAAVDVDKGGASTYELLALLATTTDCVNNLSVQLQALEEISPASNITEFPTTKEAAKEEESILLSASAR